MKYDSLLLGIMLSIFLVACNTAPKGSQVVAEAQQNLQNASACCVTLQDAKYAQLPTEKVVVKLDDKSQVKLFDGKKSYFLLYKLPEFSNSYGVALSSIAAGGGDIAVLLPRIAMYDSNFKLTREFDEKTLRNRGNNLERTVFINPENSHEQYLLIRASDLNAALERSVSVVTSHPVYVAPGVTAYTYSGSDSKVVIRPSPVGQIEVEVQGLLSKPNDSKK